MPARRRYTITVFQKIDKGPKLVLADVSFETPGPVGDLKSHLYEGTGNIGVSAVFRDIPEDLNNAG